MKKEIMLGVVLVTAFALKAKTVALWPMEYDEMHQAPNMRCAISSANGFTYLNRASTFEEETVGWNLPPNPDTFASPLSSMVSRQAFEKTYQELGGRPTVAGLRHRQVSFFGQTGVREKCKIPMVDENGSMSFRTYLMCFVRGICLSQANGRVV